MWWNKQYCERCGGKVRADEAQVQVASVPYHFSCYPRAQAPDVTRYARTRGNVYRAEYLAVEWQDTILDSTVAAAIAERVWAEIGNQRLVRQGKRSMAQHSQEHPTVRRSYHPRWLKRPAAH